MNFYELKAFAALSEQLHFAKAAAQLNMSPSALSRIISRLEEETGRELVNRSSRQVSLTDDGATFAEFAGTILEERMELDARFSGNQDTIAGTLRVYASVTACYTILPLFIRQLAAKYPAVQLSVETGDPAGAIPAVREGRAALAVAAIPEDGLSYLETIRIKKTPLIYAAAHSGPYREIGGSPQDIISSVPLILPKTGPARRRFDRWTKSRNVRPSIIAETEGNEAILALASLGLGIGLVPQIVLESGPYTNGFVVHPAGNTMGWYDIGFIRRAEIYGTRASRRIQQAVSDILHTTDWSRAGL
ncbi:MAG: LysR family transcriptional regulator [Treponemataceae bacterium]|nr:LysR family transcriptional regulator [Treponemataceae bacterium]